MCKKKIFVSALLILCTVIFFENTYIPSATTIEQQNREKKALEAEKEKVEEKVEELKAKRDAIKKSIEELDAKKQAIEAKMESYNEKIDKEEKKIEKLKLEIEVADDMQKEQYDIMKKRVKYMYENEDADYFSLILGASSVEDLLNQSEYMMEISEYDNNLVEKYKETKEYAENKKAEREERIAGLNLLLSELEVQKSENERLVEAKEAQIRDFGELIAEAGDKVKEYDLEIGKREDYIDKLIAEAERERKAKAEAAARAKAAALSAGATVADTGAKHSSSGMIWPLPASRYITSGYGYRKEVMRGSGTFHHGIDIAANTGTPIVAAKSGTVISASYHYSMGNHVILDHGEGIYTVYMHASKLSVSVGQEVSQGTTVALVGSTGMSTGPHLHFSVKLNGQYVNPMNYVSP